MLSIARAFDGNRALIGQYRPLQGQHMHYIVTRLDKTGYAVAEYACKHEKTALFLAAQALDLDPDDPRGMDWEGYWYKTGCFSVRKYFNCFEKQGTRPDVLVTCYC